jgi:hypothetical protein
MRQLIAFLPIGVAAACAAQACASSEDAPIELCARFSACFGTKVGSFGANCEVLLEPTEGPDVQPYARAWLSSVGCVADAADCEAMRACVVATEAQRAVCKADRLSRCAGNVVVHCGRDELGGPLTWDCAAGGLSCIETEAGADCGLGACDPATAQPTCDGDLLIECAGAPGRLIPEDCRIHVGRDCPAGAPESGCRARRSNTCAVVDGKARCVGDGAPCDEATFVSSCDGSTLVTCTGGRIGRGDCAPVGPKSTCGMTSSGIYACTAGGAECLHGAPEDCDDGVITYCLWGEERTLDCTEVGFSGCTAGASTSGGQVAACTP